MTVEARLLTAARESGVPVARLVAHGDGEMTGPDAAAGPLDGGWLILERVEGETIPRKLLRDEEWRSARMRLPGQIGRALAAIHAIPLTAGAGLDASDQLAQFRGLLDGLGEPHPAFELAFRRLEATRPPRGRTTIVHGDFRLGNLLVGRDGLRAVLDWELAHIGDPLEDLGWLCVRAWRFGSPLHAGGVGTREEVVGAYEAASGEAVDTGAVDWWEAVGTLKWGIMCMVQAATHLSGTTRSVELATIGRRVCENEWDLLLLLGVAPPHPGTPSGIPAAPDREGGRPPHDRPRADELIDAVRGFLADDVVPAADGRVRFHARVAANALAIVERELRIGPALAERHADRLAALGFTDDAALAAAIRAGGCDDDWHEVAGSVMAGVFDKLLVANPGYAAGRD